MDIEKLKLDKDALLEAIEEDDEIIEEFDEEMFHDMDIVRKMVDVFPYNYEYLPEELQEDKAVALECVKVRGDVYECLCEELQKDIEIMEVAICHGCDLKEIAGYKEAAPLLCKEELIRIAMENHGGNQLCYADENVWKNKELVEFAFDNGYCRVRELPEEMAAEKETIKRIVNNIPKEDYSDAIFQVIYMAEELRREEAFLLELIKEREEIFQLISRCKKNEVLTEKFPFSCDAAFCKKAYQANKKTIKYMNKEMKALVKG